MFGTTEPILHPLESTLSEQTASIISSVSPSRLRQDVLSMNYPRNRLHSPKDMVKAEEYIILAFQDAGWQTQRHPFTIKQAKGFLDYGDYSPKTYPELSGVNLIAVKPGEESNDTIVIEAHYDTVWMSPGADDNTASVAALLELARILEPYKLKYNLILATCDMEELGFIGATQLIKELATKYNLRGAIVFETMAYTSKRPNSQSVPPRFGLIYPDQAKRLKNRGYFGDNTVVIYHNNGRSLAVGFSESLAHIAGDDSVMLLRAPGDIPILSWILRIFFYSLIKQFYRADHYPFLVAGIPAIQITDSANFRNPNYHKMTDTPDTLDYDNLANIVAATATTILRLDSL
jgi:Zn-dependent M28 family amino/carboxypeptidase